MKYNVAVTFPLTLWVPDVEAARQEEAIEKARKIALETPYEDWGDDFSNATLEIVEE
jgi:hypothetical protein